MGVIKSGDTVTIKIDQVRMTRQVRPARDIQDRGMIEPDSPLGKVVIGRRVGDEVQAETPGGTVTVEILAVGG